MPDSDGDVVVQLELWPAKASAPEELRNSNLRAQLAYLAGCAVSELDEFLVREQWERITGITAEKRHQNRLMYVSERMGLLPENVCEELYRRKYNEFLNNRLLGKCKKKPMVRVSISIERIAAATGERE